MAKVKLSMPPPKAMVKVPDLALPPEPDPKTLDAVLGKGGTVPSEKKTTTLEHEGPDSDPLKSFTIRIYQSELNRIKNQQAQMRKRDRISIEAYILKAVEEKLDKDEKKLVKKKPTAH